MRLRRGLLGLALVVTLLFAWTPHPPTLIPNDKTQHGLAFVVLTLLAVYAYPNTRLWKVAVLLAGFGAAIELVQGLPFIHRDCDIYDWYADVESIVLALVLALAVRRMRLTSRQN